jgi:serine phosphatase RsbU (regulator of sigma subunit)
VQGTIATDLTLRSGDTVAMLTDGLYEWENDTGHQFGLDRLGESVRRHSACPAAHVVRGVYQDVLLHAGLAPQADDLTAMVIKRVS